MGIVIVKAAAITPEERIVPNGLGLWDNNHCAGMTELADTIKAAGAKACPSETSPTRITDLKLVASPMYQPFG